MPQRQPFDPAAIDAAIAKLQEPGRLEEAQRTVEHSAPQLQEVLDLALEQSDWFGPTHQAEVLKAAGVADPDERVRTVGTLIAEETRVAMLVGVAVGLELGHLLLDPEDHPT